MVTAYIKAAMGRARYEILPDDHSYYGEIPGFEGVWANSPALETCREQLEEVLEEWILIRVAQGLDLPVVDGRSLAVRKVA